MDPPPGKFLIDGKESSSNTNSNTIHQGEEGANEEIQIPLPMATRFPIKVRLYYVYSPVCVLALGHVRVWIGSWIAFIPRGKHRYDSNENNIMSWLSMYVHRPYKYGW